MSKHINQHIIPRVYLKPWEINSDDRKVMVKLKNSEKYKEIETSDSFFVKPDYYTYNICKLGLNEKQLKKIFKPLKGYEVSYSDIIYDTSNIEDLKKLHLEYDNFINWKIVDNNNLLNEEDKSKLKESIEKIRLLDVEIGWNKYSENNLMKIRNYVDNIISSDGKLNMSRRKKEEIISQIVLFDYRSLKGNTIIEKILDNFDRDINNEDIDNESKEKFREDIYLKMYIDYFENNQGILRKTIDIYLKESSIVFITPKGSKKFITSDNPSFNYDEKNREYGNGHYMVLTPEVLIVLASSQEKKDYYIFEISDDWVMKYNTLIENNCKDYIIKK